MLQSNSKYIQEIRQRLEENAVAREEREKRLDRFLVQQWKTLEAQEVKCLSSHCNVKICFVNKNKYGLKRCRYSVSPVCVCT